MGRRIGLVLAVLALALWIGDARAADCSTPPGNEGDVIYNSTYKVVQFCNGTDWVNAGSSGAINVGTLTNGSFCTTDGSVINCTTAAISLTSQVSGTLQAAQFPATLPAVSGANLTTLNASNLSSGTVPAERLGSGAADSSTYLRGDQTWAAAASADAGTLCGLREVWCNYGSPFYDMNSPITKCKGNTLTAVCGTAGGLQVSTVSGCPSGYTGSYAKVTSYSGYFYHIFCVHD